MCPDSCVARAWPAEGRAWVCRRQLVLSPAVEEALGPEASSKSVEK